MSPIHREEYHLKGQGLVFSYTVVFVILTWAGFCWLVGVLFGLFWVGWFLWRKKQWWDSKEESEIWVSANISLLSYCFDSRKDASQKLCFCLFVLPVVLCFMVVSMRIYLGFQWELVFPLLQGHMWYKIIPLTFINFLGSVWISFTCRTPHYPKAVKVTTDGSIIYKLSLVPSHCSIIYSKLIREADAP